MKFPLLHKDGMHLEVRSKEFTSHFCQFRNLLFLSNVKGYLTEKIIHFKLINIIFAIRLGGRMKCGIL